MLPLKAKVLWSSYAVCTGSTMLGIAYLIVL
jgi:hypothetical protein